MTTKKTILNSENHSLVNFVFLLMEFCVKKT